MDTKLAKYGMTGVAFALIMLLGVCVNQLFTITGNHIDHNTAAIEEQTKAISEQTQVFGEMKVFIEKNNEILNLLQLKLTNSLAILYNLSAVSIGITSEILLFFLINLLNNSSRIISKR